MTNIPEKFIQAFPGCHRSPASGLYSYSRAREIRLDFVIVTELEEPVLAATHHPQQARVLFRDYPRLAWIADLGANPPVLYSRTGKEPLKNLIPNPDPAPRTRRGLSEALLALALALVTGLILFLAC